jgi:hypothetical protein
LAALLESTENRAVRVRLLLVGLFFVATGCEETIRPAKWLRVRCPAGLGHGIFSKEVQVLSSGSWQTVAQVLLPRIYKLDEQCVLLADDDRTAAVLCADGRNIPINVTECPAVFVAAGRILCGTKTGDGRKARMLGLEWAADGTLLRRSSYPLSSPEADCSDGRAVGITSEGRILFLAKGCSGRSYLLARNEIGGLSRIADGVDRGAGYLGNDLISSSSMADVSLGGVPEGCPR